MNEDLDFPWDVFFELQRATDTSVISPTREEAVTQILDDLLAGNVPRDREAMMRRYRSLVANRAKKYRSRSTVAPQVEHHERQMNQRRDAFEEVVDRELASLVMNGVEDDDRLLLVDVFIDGCTYDEAAFVRCKPVGTVKARVSRVRKQIRSELERRGVTAALLAA